MSLMSTAAPAPSTPLAALARPGGPPPAEGEDAGFAQALEAASTRPPEDPAADEPAEGAASETRDGKRSRALRRTPNAALPGTDATEGPRRAAPTAHTAEADETTAAAEDDTAPADDTLAAWVDSLPLPPLPPGTPAAPARGGKAPADAERGNGAEAAKAVEAAAGRPSEAGAEIRGKDPAAAAAANATNPPPTLPALAAVLQARAATPTHSSAGPASAEAVAARPTAPRELPLPAVAGSDPLALATPLAAPWTAAAARLAEPAAVAQAEVRAEVGTPEFAPALASQLSVLVRDGIEQAQLKLNPAELGPIEVRISIDGSQAQVDFSAAQATTRQALQEAVPALAATLRESGLTLSGGGVFEQPRDPRNEARGDSPRGSGREPEGPREAALAGLAPASLPRARGVLDLYA